MLCEWQHRYMLMHQTFNPRIHVQFFIPLGLISINSRNKEQVNSQKMLTNDLSNVTVKDGFILFLLPWHHFRFTVLFDEGLGNQNGILDHHRSFSAIKQLYDYADEQTSISSKVADPSWTFCPMSRLKLEYRSCLNQGMLRNKCREAWKKRFFFSSRFNKLFKIKICNFLSHLFHFFFLKIINI